MLVSPRAYLFLDIPSALFIIGCVVAMLISTGNIKFIIKGFKQAIFGKENLDPETESRILKSINFTIYITIASGVLGTLIGIICILSSLDNVQNAGASFSVSLITLLYSFVIAFFILLPVKFTVQRGRAGSPN